MWKRTDALSERVKFILEWERRWKAAKGRIDVAELSRIYGVSRQTAHVWIKRYQDAGHDLRAMQERSRRPSSNPRAVSLDMQDRLVAARKQHPRWGPLKLRAWLVERHPQISFPSVSGIGAVLRRRGMTAARKPRRGTAVSATIAAPFPDCERPNDVWCMDFKGWFLTHDSVKCYPFTLIDALSRMLLRCEALTEPNGDFVRHILDSAFREYGLPKRLRSDGGPPFFSAASPASLSKLGIWLLRLGITLECIAPAKPQQNGRLERFHRTLKLEVGVTSDWRSQQRAFDSFRGTYNTERPHAALGLVPPAAVHRRSTCHYPRGLLSTGDTPGHTELVDRRGWLRWRPRNVFLGEALALERVSLWPGESDAWEVYLGAILLGHIDLSTDRGFVPRRRGKGPMRLSLIDE